MTSSLLPAMPSNFSFEMAYVALSAVIAVGIWIQIALLRRNQGKMPKTTAFHMLSLSDSLWVPISVAAWFFLDFDQFAITISAAYIVYTVLGWVYAAKTIWASDVPPKSPEDIVFNDRYLTFCQSFALVFFGLCMAVVFVPQDKLSFMKIIV